MGDIWLIADLHLGHKKLIQGWDYDGITNSGPRKQFKDIDEMHQLIMDNWNDTVKSQDKVYVLGDITWNGDWMIMLDNLPGKKRAVLGNHDDGDPRTYQGTFDALYGAKTLPGGFLLTHVPVHESQLERRSHQHNIHGHTHDEIIEKLWHDQWIDVQGDAKRFMAQTVKIQHPKYTCVSCEQVNYTPLNLEEVRLKLK